MSDASSPQVAKGFLSRISPRTKGVVLLVLAIFIWGGNWPVMKIGLNHIDPFWFAIVRFVLGVLCLFALQAMTKDLKVPTLRDIPVVLTVGVLQMFGFTLLVNYALLTADAGHSAVLAYTTSVWVVPAAYLFFGERVSIFQWIGTMLALAGVVAMVNPQGWQDQGSNMLYANLMLIGAAVCWAICILHLRYSRAVSSAYHLAPWQMLVALVPLLVFAKLFVGPYTGDGSTELLWVLLYVGPLATAFCFCAVIAANRWMNSATISIAMLGVPVVGLLASIVVLDEHMTGPLALGVVAILAGIFLICLPKKPPAA